MTTTTTEPVSPEEGTEVPEPAYVVEAPVEALGPAMIQHEGEAAPHPVEVEHELAVTGAGTELLAVVGGLALLLGATFTAASRLLDRGITSQ